MVLFDSSPPRTAEHLQARFEKPWVSTNVTPFMLRFNSSLRTSADLQRLLDIHRRTRHSIVSYQIHSSTVVIEVEYPERVLFFIFPTDFKQHTRSLYRLKTGPLIHTHRKQRS